jgi:hypothetical protein
VVPEGKVRRRVACYLGADPADPMKPGLTPSDDYPYPGGLPAARGAPVGRRRAGVEPACLVSLVRSLLALR